MRLGLFTLAAASLIFVPLSAQTRSIVPAAANGVEGDGLSAVPFYTDRVRSSQYYGVTLLRGLIPAGKSITEIAYRRDGRALNTTLMRHTTTPQWTIRMGRYTLDARNPPTRYLSPGSTVNTLTTVFIKDQMNFPDLPGGIGPMAFRIRFKLDRPFVYAGDGLVIDHFAYETRSASFSYYIDAVRTAVDRGSFQAYGSPCPAGKNRASAIPSNPGNEQPLSFLLFGARPFAPAALFLGASKTRWFNVPLPIDLSPAGLTGCSLYTSVDFVLPAVTFTTGAGDVSIKLPADPALAGLMLFSQWVVQDPQISFSAPLTFSNGVEVTIGRTVGNSGVDGAMVYGVGNVALSTYGFLDRGIVLVTELTWQ